VTQYGQVVERVTRVCGPLKRREVYEEYDDSVVPRFTHLTLSGRLGTRVLGRGIARPDRHVERLRW
jgi:hypothetical protein